MPESTNLISMIHKSSGLCIHQKMGKLIGFCMMVCKAFCNKFHKWNLIDLHIIGAEGYSLGHSSMSHLIDTQEVGGKRGYIHNIEKGAMLKIYCTLSFWNDGRVISDVDGNDFVGV